MIMDFETFKDTVLSTLEYTYLFPESHFEEADYCNEPHQLAEDIDDAFGVVIDLLRAQAQTVVYVEGAGESAAYHQWMQCANMLCDFARELNYMLEKHYEDRTLARESADPSVQAYYAGRRN